MKTEFGCNNAVQKQLIKEMYWSKPFEYSLGSTVVLPWIYAVITVFNEVNIPFFWMYAILMTGCTVYNVKCVKDEKYEIAARTQIGIIIASAGIAIALLNVDVYQLKKIKIVFILSLIELIVLLAICIYYLLTHKKKIETIKSNVSNCLLKLDKDYISGVSFSNIEIENSGNYFELQYQDIRNIRKNDSGNCNLLIDYKGGTYRLSIETVDEAIKNISYIKSRIEKGLTPFGRDADREEKKEEKAETKQDSIHSSFSIKKVPVRVSKTNNGMIVCPTCTVLQLGTRYSCSQCGQVFINGQPGIPYWCGNCGKPGPFDGDGECSDCQGNIKIYNK